MLCKNDFRFFASSTLVMLVVIGQLDHCVDGFPEMLNLFEDAPCGGVGDAGDDDDNMGSTCTNFKRCVVAIEQVKRKRHHNLARCSFDRDDEIVCCPNESIIPDAYDLSSSSTPTTLSTAPPTQTPPTTDSVTAKIVEKFPEILNQRSFKACEDLVVEVGSQITPQILDGDNATLGEFPHMAVLGTEKNSVISWSCGASLITDEYLVTAAHCIINAERTTPTLVRLGRVDVLSPNDNDAQEITIANITTHPNFNRRRSTADIALVKLARPIRRTANVHPACLYYRNNDPLGLVATGWGVTKLNSDANSQFLQRANLVPVPLAECNATYTRLRLLTLSNAQLCAQTVQGRQSDTCQGDSGGPLQVAHRQGSSIYSIVGVTSTGNGCGGAVPGVYTRVFSYLEWIEGIVWPE